ncbi:MAG TPA: hypothetical protein VGE29_13780 [Prosthecobacter sp.]
MTATASLRGDTDKTRQEEAKIQQRSQAVEASFRQTVKEASYCVAYVLSDAPGRDPDSFLDPEKVICQEQVSARTIGMKRLPPEAGQRILDATFSRTASNPLSACYDPHHLFVFYAGNGHPLAAVELCLTCGGVDISPSDRDRDVLLSISSSADLNALAKVLEEAGLPLTPFKSLDEYRARK